MSGFRAFPRRQKLEGREGVMGIGHRDIRRQALQGDMTIEKCDIGRHHFRRDAEPPSSGSPLNQPRVIQVARLDKHDLRASDFRQMLPDVRRTVPRWPAVASNRRGGLSSEFTAKCGICPAQLGSLS